MLGGCDSLQKHDETHRGVGLHWLATSRSCCQSLKHAMCQLEVTAAYSLIHCQIRQICQIWGKSHIAHAHWQYQSLQRDATTQCFGAQGDGDHRWTWSLPWGQFRQARILNMIFWHLLTMFHHFSPKGCWFSCMAQVRNELMAVGWEYTTSNVTPRFGMPPGHTWPTRTFRPGRDGIFHPCHRTDSPWPASLDRGTVPHMQ